MPRTLEIDGRIIELPDDPEQMNQIITFLSQNSRPKTDQEILEGRTGLTNFAAGINSGISNTLGIPVDLTNLALQGVNKGLDAVGAPDGLRVPISESPVGGSQSFRRALEGSGIPATKNPNPEPFDRFLGNAGEDLGATAVTFPMLASSAVQNAASPAIQAFAQPFKEAIRGGGNKLAKLLGIEGVAATGVAGGRTVAQEAELGPTGELLLGAAGGLSAGGLAQGIQSTGRAITRNTDDVMDDSARVLQEAAANPRRAAQNTRRNLERFDSLPPEFSPTTAAVADDVGLAEFERGVVQGGAGRDAKVALAQNRTEQTRTLTNALNDLDPKLNPRVPRQGSADRSRDVRAALDSEFSTFKRKADQLYNPATIDPEGAIGFRTTILKDAAREARKKQASISGTNAQFPEDRVTRFENAPSVQGLEELMETRKAINADIRAASTAGRQAEVDILQGLRGAVDETLEDLAQGGRGVLVKQSRGQGRDYVAGAVDRFRNANAFYRENAGRFKEGVAGDVLKTRPDGSPAVLPQDTAARFLNRDGEGIEALYAALNGNRQGVESVQQFLTAEMAEAAFDAQGRFSQSRLYNFLRRNPEQIDQILLEPRALKAGLSSPENTRRLLGILEKFPERRAQLKDALWDNLQTVSTDQDGILTPGGLKRFLQTNGKSLAAVYSDDPKQLQRIRLIAEALDSFDKPDKLARMIPGSQTAPNKTAIDNAQNLLKLTVAATHPGSGILVRALSPLRALVGPDEAVALMVQRSLKRPDLAAALLDRNVGPETISLFRQEAEVLASQIVRTEPALANPENAAR